MRWPSLFSGSNTEEPRLCFAWFPRRVVDLQHRYVTIWLEDVYRVPTGNHYSDKYRYRARECAALDRLTGEQK